MAFSSYFEVNVTPTQKRDSEGGDGTPILDFRPFSGNPKVIFKNINVGNSVSRSIVFRNPQNAVLEVELVKLPPPKACLTFSENKILLQPGHEFTLKVNWLPRTEGKSIYSVHLKTNTNSRHYFSIVCVSIPKKKKIAGKTNLKKSCTKKIVLKSESSLETKKNIPIVKKSPVICGNADNLQNISSETYDIVSPEPKNLTVELQEVGINYAFSEPLITTPYMKKENFFSSVGFSPLPSSFPAQKPSRETFSLVPNVSYMYNPVKKKRNIQSQSSIPELDISIDSLSPKSSPKSMTNFDSNLFTVKQMHSPPEECYEEKGVRNLDVLGGKEMQEMCEDLNISGFSEIEAMLAKKSMKCKIDELELPFSPITTFPQTRKFDTPTLHKSLFVELQNCEENIDSKLDEFCESESFKFTPMSLPNVINKPGGNRRETFGSYTTSFREDAENFSTPFSKQLPINEEILSDVEEMIEVENVKQSRGVSDTKEKNSLQKGSFVNSSTIFTKSETQLKCIKEETKKTIDYSYSLSNSKNCLIEDNSISLFQYTSRKNYDSSPLPRQKKTSQTEETKYLLITPPRNRINMQIKENIVPRSSAKNSIKSFSSNQANSYRERKDFSEKVSRKSTAKKITSRALSKLTLLPKVKKNLEKETILMDADKVLNEQINPSYCITSTIINPFLDCNVYYNQEWFDSREKEFVRWLNVLLTPPEQLSSCDELPKVDVADLWKRSCKTDVAPAPSRETVSSLYLVNHRLDSLRRKACSMFKLPSVSQVLSKVVVQIDKDILSIRKDRNIVRDIGLKCTAVELLLCYNPLWLRIGIETVLGRTMVIKSNSDIVGITGFIAQYVLSDPYLVHRYCYPGVTNMFKPGFEEAIRKHILKKFFCLVFFLDYAKQNKLIVHNPCLFCRDAQYKESREILLAFAREFLAGIGDVTKHLKSLGYVVQHKQTYLDEFSYAVTKLGADLRDGVRLTRVTEIILQESSLSSGLRVPAVSILQKVHNVKIALTALAKAGHALEGNITARDIVDGHKEKTMSLLWQIIYRFQLTRFTCAANKIQDWYRSLPVLIKRRIFLRKEAARKKEIENKACTIIQKHWRRYMAMKRYALYVESINKIKHWFKSVILMKKVREQYLNKRDAAIKIQRFVRNFLLKKRVGKVEEARKAVLKISLWYQSICHLRKDRDHYKKITKSTIIIQRWFRSAVCAKKCRNEYLSYRDSAVKIQRWFRSVLEVKREREQFLKRKSAILCIQRKLRATILMKKIKENYENQKNAACTIKTWYRSCCAMRYQRKQYLSLYCAVIKIQRFFRYRSGLKRIRSNIKNKKLAARRIELWYQATSLMKQERQKYLLLQKTTLFVQRKYRAKLLSQSQRYHFLLLQKSVVIIQKWFRGILLMEAEMQIYRQKRSAVILIQQWFRRVILTKKQRQLCLTMKQCALKIQIWYRASKLMLNDSQEFQRKRAAAKTIQCWYRSIVLMRQQRDQYLLQKLAAMKIQRLLRAKVVSRVQRDAFLLKRTSAIKIQRWYRSTVLCIEIKMSYREKRCAIILIQQWFRKVILTKKQRQLYLTMKQCAVKIQIWYRASKLMMNDSREFQRKRAAAKTIQCWYRSIVLMRQQRDQYLLQKLAAMKIQRLLRAKVVSRVQRDAFLLNRTSAVKIQRWYRSRLYLKHEMKFILNRNYISSLTSENHINNLEKQKAAVKVIENWYHTFNSKKQEVRKKILKQQESAIKIQALWRGYNVRKHLKRSGLIIVPAKKHVINQEVCLRALYMKALSSFSATASYAIVTRSALIIESCTRLSCELCEQFFMSDHLFVLLYLMNSSNRSIPAEQLLIVLMKILIHILNHPDGARHVLSQEPRIIVPTLLTLTNVWCMKRNETIFCLICSVWWLLAQDLKESQMLEKMGVLQQLEKCYKKVMKWRNINSKNTTIIKEKNLPILPTIWSKMYGNESYAFQNGIIAIVEVLKRFNINF